MAANNVCQLNLSLRKNLPINIWHAVSWHPPVIVPQDVPHSSRQPKPIAEHGMCARDWSSAQHGSLYQQSLCQSSPLSHLNFGSSYLIYLPLPSPYLPMPIPLPLYFTGSLHEFLVLPNSAWHLLLSRSKLHQLMLRVVQNSDSRVDFQDCCYSLSSCKWWPFAPDSLMVTGPDSSLFIQLVPVVTQKRVLVEETSLASTIIQAFESEQHIQGQWNWLVMIKGHEGIIRNWRQLTLKK